MNVWIAKGRLETLCRENTRRGYRKTTDGVIAAERVTLAAMKGACPHFADWLNRIEALGSNPLTVAPND